MKSLFFCIILSAFPFCRLVCMGQTYALQWQTNSINVVFSDQTLPYTAKEAIVADLSLCFQGWATNAVIMVRAINGSVGYMDYGTRSPCYQDGVDFPKNITTNTTGGIALQIPKALSDAYTNAFAFAAANSNIVAAAYEFVAFVSSTNFYGVTSNQISNYVLYNQATPAVYRLGFPDITNALRYPTYYKPSALGFYHSPDGPAATNLWMFVPGATYPSGGYVEWSPFPAIWHDGKWKFCIWEENPHYKLPQ